jgi:preprotein translocase subunit SecY
LIIFSGIVAGLPTGIVTLLELGRQGNYNFLQIAFLFALICGLVAFIVFCERAQRRITVQYPKRQAGGRVMASDSNHIPLKINTAGVIPPIFASSLLILPLSVVKFLGAEKSPFLNDLSRWLGHGEPLFMVLYGALIIFFAFFYTAIVFNPQENADMLKKNGGFIPGIRPGKSTADYFDYVLTRITVLGAAYITIVCLIPEILVKGYALPFYIGGTSVLIAVTVTMETVAQIHSHLIAHQYESLIRRAKLKGKRR